jgi:hypothetical protein
MKIYVFKDEQYPIYIYSKNKSFSGKCVDIPEDKKLWLDEVFKNYGKAQNYLEELYKKCTTCYGYGMWAWGNTKQPMGPMDACDGVPTLPCPECGADANPKKKMKK